MNRHLLSWCGCLLTLAMTAGTANAVEAVPPSDVVAKKTKQVQAVVREGPKRSPGATAAALMASAGTATDPADRYAYLREALQMASKAGESSLAISAMQQLTAGFSINVLQERADLALQLARQSKQVMDASLSAQLLIAVCREAILAGDDALAARLATAATGLSGRHRDPALTALAKDVSAWVPEIAAAAKKLPVDDLLNSLSPADATIRGRYSCFLLDDWKSGLPHLAAGEDAVLAKLAKSELAPTAEVAQAIELGDGWWSQAEQQRGLARTLLQRHAEKWYRQALPKLTGITQTRVANRLEELPFDLLANPGSIDLWPLMTLSKGSFQGEWKNQNGVLVVEKNDAGDHITIPVVPHGDYRFTGRFEQLSAEGEVMLLIPIMAADGPHSLNYFLYSDGSAMHLINDSMVRSTSPQGRIAPNTAYEFQVDVQQGERIQIKIRLNNQEIFSWHGPANTNFGNHRKAKPTRPGALGVGAWNAKAAFYRARVTPLSGRLTSLDE